MASELVDLVAVDLQDLCDEQPQLAVTQDGHRGATRDPHLVENLARRGERLGENSSLRGDRIGYNVQVRFGQREEFAKRAGVTHNPEHGARGAMPPEAAPAPRTVAARKIDLADHALADQVLRIGRNNLTYEFMAGHARKSVIAALEFEIGVADACLNEADQGEAFGAFGWGRLPEFNSALIQLEGEHFRAERLSMQIRNLAGRPGFEPRYADPSEPIVNKEIDKLARRLRQNPQRRRNKKLIRRETVIDLDTCRDPKTTKS